MPRLRRVQYPNAIYHIINRGRNKEDIFHDESYFQLFLDLMQEAHIKFNAVFHSYCLMSNHYHILLQTPDANLSKIMHFINSNFVKKYNFRRKVEGSLFKGRYKAILVEKEYYFVELNKYIHRNPAKIVSDLKSYKWSSYPAYLDLVPTPSWLNKKETLQILGLENDLEGYLKWCLAPKEPGTTKLET